MAPRVLSIAKSNKGLLVFVLAPQISITNLIFKFPQIRIERLQIASDSKIKTTHPPSCYNFIMRKRLVPILFIVAISLLLYLVSRSFTEEEIITFINEAGFFAPLVFMLLLLLTLIIAPLSGSPIIYAGYFAFGQNVIFYSVLTSYISFVLNFIIARKWGRNIVKKFVGKNEIKKIDDLTENHGAAILILLRLFQGSMGDFVSFAMGLTNMKFKTYFIVSLIASIPGTIIWYYLSLRASTPTQFTVIMLVFTLSLSFIFITAGVFWKKFVKK